MIRDAVVIGGGFYGTVIAAWLVRERGLRDVLLVERGSALMTRASFNNQARIHHGYHYPRSISTAYRSRVNFPRFVARWPEAVTSDFTNIYAVARRNSKITARQFERFCHDIGARLDTVDEATRQMFDFRTVEAAYLVEEYVFDATRLAAWAAWELDACDVETRLNCVATRIEAAKPDHLRIALTDRKGETHAVEECQIAINCTYSELNQLEGIRPAAMTPLKHEITELALVTPTPSLAGIGITLMDGPFFSMMPFPSRGLHSVSHVRYTPHMNWLDTPGIHPYARLDTYEAISRFDRMRRDIARYFPAIDDVSHVDSLFEVKTVLARNESDDGRPILVEAHANLPGLYSVLGAKIDNVFDVLERLNVYADAWG